MSVRAYNLKFSYMGPNFFDLFELSYRHVSNLFVFSSRNDPSNAINDFAKNNTVERNLLTYLRSLLTYRYLINYGL